MTLTLELAPEVEAHLESEAEKREISVQDYVLTLIEQNRPKPQNGAEMVARMKELGFIGMWADREDIGDSSEYARKLRMQVEKGI